MSIVWRAVFLATIFMMLACGVAVAYPRDVNEKGDPGSISVDPVPTTWVSSEPVLHERLKISLGLEETHPAFQQMYSDIARQYRHMAPLVHDLPEFQPGLQRFDLPRNDPRRQMMNEAVQSSFNRALENMALQYLDQAFLSKTPLHKLIPHIKPPTPDPTLPSNVVSTYSVLTPEQARQYQVGNEDGDAALVPSSVEAVEKRANSIFGPPRFIFGVGNRLRSAVIGVDLKAFSLQTSFARGSGMGAVWGVAPIRGKDVEGSIGVSSKGEIYINAWIRF